MKQLLTAIFIELQFLFAINDQSDIKLQSTLIARRVWHGFTQQYITVSVSNTSRNFSKQPTRSRESRKHQEKNHVY